jgi:hypothetical protein
MPVRKLSGDKTAMFRRGGGVRGSVVNVDLNILLYAKVEISIEYFIYSINCIRYAIEASRQTQWLQAVPNLVLAVTFKKCSETQQINFI